MRNESEVLAAFNQGNDNSAAYWRDRMIIEVLLDVRSLLKALAEKF